MLAIMSVQLEDWLLKLPAQSRVFRFQKCWVLSLAQHKIQIPQTTM